MTHLKSIYRPEELFVYPCGISSRQSNSNNMLLKYSTEINSVTSLGIGVSLFFRPNCM